MTKKNKKTKTFLSLPVDDNMIAIPRIELDSISYGDSSPAQNNKLSTLEKIGFKKIPSEDGFDILKGVQIVKQTHT
jgi:hypothetical protein